MESSIMDNLPPDMTGEAALRWIPERGGPPEEVCIEARDLLQIDAFGGAALRAAVEYYARYLQRQVLVSPPADRDAWTHLNALLELLHPEKLILPNHPPVPAGPTPRTMFIPTLRVTAEHEGEQLGERLVDLSSASFPTQLRFLAGAVVELVRNAVMHAPNSPIGATVACLHYRPTHAIQLVVCDMGETVARYPDAPDVLEAAVHGAPDGAIQSMVDLAASRDLSLDVVLAAGDGRLRTRGAGWEKSLGSRVNGFAAAFIVPDEI